jgi:hypothetical protein
LINTLKIQVKPEEIIEGVKGMEKRKREAFLEDLIAAISPEYLESIREARSDFKAKRVKTHEEVFGKYPLQESDRRVQSETNFTLTPIEPKIRSSPHGGGRIRRGG